MQPKGRKHISATILAAAGIALAAGGLVAPAIASAERSWDIGAYDKCMNNNGNVDECCIISGGDLENGKCYAPVNAQAEPGKPAPGSLGVPGTVHTRPGKVSTLP